MDTFQIQNVQIVLAVKKSIDDEENSRRGSEDGE